MKNPRFVVVFLAVMGLAGLALGAGCGPHAAPAAVPDPISVNTLDGGEGVPVDGTFKYVFSGPVTASTVTTSTFFMVKNEVSLSSNKSVVVEDICDSTQAIDATVECSSFTECTLTPADLLEYSTVYSICLTDGMQYTIGEQFGNFMSTFTTEEEGPLSLNTLDGAVDVPVDSSFRYRFLKEEIDTSTVDTFTYFIVQTPAAASISKADVNSAICNVANAVTSGTTCTRWSCTIVPSAYLEYATGYTAYLTSGISYTSSSEFNGFMASFTTSTEPITPWNISSIKLVRLDDTELELTDQPIPRMVHVKFTLSGAVTDESERATFESSVTLIDEDNNTVDGTYEWADDFLSVTFTPSHRLEYKTEYTINVDTSILPLLSLSKALSAGDMFFTTMTEKDINGDGFADVIVGAYRYPDDYFKGRAYVYLGLASGISDCDLGAGCVPHATITGKYGGGGPGEEGDWLGYNPSVIGDVNADGFADVIVDAKGHETGSDKGQAYIFLGTADGIDDCDHFSDGCVPDTIITGENSDDGLAYSASDAGDVNGDGFDDVIMSSQGYPGGDYKGQAYIFLGSVDGVDDCDLTPPSTCVPHATITGKSDGDWLEDVSTAGDVNGDGYDDIIMGASGYNAWALQGQAYIFLGGSTLSGDLGAADADATITGKSDGDYFGFSISTAGDVNGDGYADVIVGAYEYNAGSKKGQAYIFLGGSGLSGDLGAADADATITGTSNGDGDRLGYSVSNAGDVDGDGYADVIIGAYGYDKGSYKGQAYIFLGGSGLSGDLGAANADATITGASNLDGLGHSVSNTGDVDGDGYADVIIGAYGYDNGTEKGRAYIFMGSEASISDCDLRKDGGCTADTTLTGENGDDRFGMVK